MRSADKLYGYRGERGGTKEMETTSDDYSTTAGRRPLLAYVLLEQFVVARRAAPVNNCERCL